MSLLFSFVLALSLFPQTPVPRPPRDPAPDPVQGASDDHYRTEAALKKKIQANPTQLGPRLALARFQEDTGDYDGAVATLIEAKAAFPKSVELLTVLAGLYNRIGDFENTIATLEQAEQLEPQDRERAQRVAVFYWEKAFRDHKLSDEQKSAYVRAGIAATDRALAIDPDYAQALTYKNILLRMQANTETNRSVQQQLIAQADELRARAIELQKQAGAAAPAPGRVSVAPVPPPPPEGGPVRVGNGVQPPSKIRDVKPVYPQDAMASKVQGVVIIEATIDTNGFVSDARVLRSIPLLDEAALDAVKQWQFTPTLLNGQPVPVIMTVTVNFTVR